MKNFKAYFQNILKKVDVRLFNCRTSGIKAC